MGERVFAHSHRRRRRSFCPFQPAFHSGVLFRTFLEPEAEGVLLDGEPSRLTASYRVFERGRRNRTLSHLFGIDRGRRSGDAAVPRKKNTTDAAIHPDERCQWAHAQPHPRGRPQSRSVHVPHSTGPHSAGNAPAAPSVHATNRYSCPLITIEVITHNRRRATAVIAFLRPRRFARPSKIRRQRGSRRTSCHAA